MAVEVLLISTAASFAPLGSADLGGHTYVGLQVIWAIGASMIALAAAQYLGARTCLIIGAAIIFGHNLLDPVWPAGSTTGDEWRPLWIGLHARNVVTAGPFWIFFSYPLLPWIGVMFVGYGAAGLFRLPPAQRDGWLLRIGIALLARLRARASPRYLRGPAHLARRPGNLAATVMSFLGTTKYPPSLMYLLMTLGPAAIFCAFAERIRGRAKEILVTFGRAPFAFYVAHLYLIHAIALTLGVMQGFAAQQFLTHYRFFPKGYGVSLAGVYLIWIAVVAALYPLCRWVVSVKARRSSWWLSYV